MKEQSSLGGKAVSRAPSYNHTKIARVTSTKDFHKYGRIDVIFLDYGQPAPVWVFNDLDREPVDGDQVLVGFVDGRKDTPYMIGFLKNGSYTTNFFVMKKDKIKLQLPVFNIGVKDGKAHKDVQSHLLDNGKQKERAYIELSPTEVLIHFPTSEAGTNPAIIKVTATEVLIDHPVKIKHHNGSKEVARKGDTVQVTVSGTVSGGTFTGTGTGTITSGSSKTMIE